MSSSVGEKMSSQATALLLELRMTNLNSSGQILQSYFEGANKHAEIMELFTQHTKLTREPTEQLKASEENFAGKLKELFEAHSKLAEMLLGYFESIQTISAKLSKE